MRFTDAYNRDFDDFSKHARGAYEIFDPVTLPQMKHVSSQWASAAYAGAFSRLHINASGLAAHFYVLHGKRAIWIPRTLPFLAGSYGWDFKETDFECIYLGEGDEL